MKTQGKHVVECPRCENYVTIEDDKASILKGLAAGAAAGGATGATIGLQAGAGTGIVTGGAGFAGMPLFVAIGGSAGALIGGLSGGWYRDKRLLCPECKKVFKNPRA
jgi:hypothetical protein